MLDQILSCSVTGAPETVRAGLAELVQRFQPDELIINGQIHDHLARLKSFQIAADAMQSLDQPVAAE